MTFLVKQSFACNFGKLLIAKEPKAELVIVRDEDFEKAIKELKELGVNFPIYRLGNDVVAVRVVGREGLVIEL